MIHHLFFATLLILQSSLGAFAQQQPAPTASPSQSVPGPQQRPAKKADEDDVVRITTNLVQLDAVVTDSKGRVVTDLAAEEFDILENGKSQKITNLFLCLTGIKCDHAGTTAETGRQNRTAAQWIDFEIVR